ncbi:patatin-like phospholipase family protein [Chitinophaga alhagiae]|uniref:patatin-like phospholipase family protein n=1 Tax=Chitinophaga alhagiae TaxID=2203219 RepID=UPI000E5B2B0D|nr:patatin-like phospholipase family protein [Chitinophaga alhagiae]
MSFTQKPGPEYFTQAPEVTAVLDALKNRFGERFEQLVISDTLDKDGRQYVHLVQEGGGVLGVALVGYTYILEKAGIRFMRLAGTSAGAINTTLLAVVREDKAAGLTKSERILQYLCNKPFFDFVDGHPFAKKLIKWVIKTEHFARRIKKGARRVGIALAALLLTDVVSTGLRHHYPVFNGIALVSYILTGMMLLGLALAAGYGSYLISRLKNRGFGINPGKNFTDWIKMIMAENGVQTIEDLERVSGKMPEGLHIRNVETDRSLGDDPTRGLRPDITLITSDIITQNKIEFPKMWNLFRENQQELHPAEFVRASMSIPIFFESHIIRNIPRELPIVQTHWRNHLLMEPEDIPTAVRFVDGGVLSNFPINILYNPEVTIPRLPTLGIELNDATPADNTLNQADNLGLADYLGKLFNTVRYYYDKDFLLKNSLFRKGIGVIDVHAYNWLDFNIPSDKQRELFVLGAQAAGKFLLEDFNWEEYKTARIVVHQAVNTSGKDMRGVSNILTKSKKKK